MQFAGVNAVDVRANLSTEIEVAADLVMLFGFRHHISPGIQMFVQEFRLTGHALVMLRAIGTGPAADLLVVAFDVFLFDEAFQIFARGIAFAIDRLRAFHAIGLHHGTERHA